MTDFAELNLHRELLKNLSSLNYKTMTAIQSLSLPAILQGNDVIGQGKTGSGKTAAFGLGILQKLDVKDFKTQAIVLCPTRELADQVAEHIRKLARTIHNIKILTLCGGTPFEPQIASLTHSPHIVVGTPGRIEDHLRKNTLKLNHINILVLDEADRMLDMGFAEIIEKIIAKIPKNRQTLLFSATYPEEIADIANRVMHKPIMVNPASIDEKNPITEYFYNTNTDEKKLSALRILLAKHKCTSVLVFCNTKVDTQKVADKLAYYGFYALAIHGDLEQRERDQALIRFANKSITVLVATDVAARGLDIDSLDMVINFNPAHDPETHTHRIGRTGRAGRSGVACTLYGDTELHKLEALEINNGSPAILPNDEFLHKPPKKPLMTTLKIDGGKKHKLRPGDIVGALTGISGIPADAIGKIHIASQWAYVAVSAQYVKTALEKIKNDKIKGKSFRTRLLF